MEGAEVRKKLDRGSWLVLGELGYYLCDFCKFSKGTCESPRCTHPLGEKTWMGEEVLVGGDCWGFRPAYDAETAADIVGLWLTGQAIA